MGGPLKGAEIALVAGTRIKVGSGDGCDVLVSDPSLGDVAFELEVAEDEVTIITPDGTTKTLLDYEAHTFGASSFAVGAAEDAWPEVVWPEKGAERKGRDADSAPGRAAVDGATPPKAEPLRETPKEEKAEAEDAKGKHRYGWLLLALLLVEIVLVLLILFHQRVHWDRFMECTEEVVATPRVTLADVAGKYGVAVVETNGQVVLRGNFRTRAERLEVTAAAFQAKPGVELDLMDDESLDESANALVAMVAADAVKVETATNRMVTLRGDAGTKARLNELLAAMRRDIPGLANVDCDSVVCGLEANASVTPVAEEPEEPTVQEETPTAVLPQATGSVVVVRQPYARAPRKERRPVAAPVRLPLCGILTVPYPCIILKNGSRVFEGGELGGYTVEKITATAVTLRSDAKTFEWKP